MVLLIEPKGVTMIYTSKPRDFAQKIEVVSCFLESDGEILLLLRQKHKPQGGTWGLPAGKVDSGESPLEAILRELREETGYMATAAMTPLDILYVRLKELDILYHSYRLSVATRPAIRINTSEHKQFAWVTPKRALHMHLIHDLDACIRHFYKPLAR